MFERVNDKAKDRDADAGIGHIKGRPRVQEFRNVRSKIEKQKIDHVTVQEPIGHVAEDAGEKQRERNITPRIARVRSQQERDNKDERDAGERDEKQVVVLEGTESGAGIRHVNEMKEIGDDCTGIGGIDGANDPPFRQLIERVERQRKKDDDRRSSLLETFSLRDSNRHAAFVAAIAQIGMRRACSDSTAMTPAARAFLVFASS